MSTTAASWDDVRALFVERTGWTITVESGVTMGDVTATYANEAWAGVLTAIVTDQGRCIEFDGPNSTVTITSCSSFRACSYAARARTVAASWQAGSARNANRRTPVVA
jgi:hypothetical protein